MPRQNTLTDMMMASDKASAGPDGQSKCVVVVPGMKSGQASLTGGKVRGRGFSVPAAE